MPSNNLIQGMRRLGSKPKLSLFTNSPLPNSKKAIAVIRTFENPPGVITVTIRVSPYGQAGEHWRDVLSRPNHGGYGKIYIQRFGANLRRYLSCYELRDYYRGVVGANLDECPGAMFIWTTGKPADVEPIDAIDNQKLGRELGNALRRFSQTDERDLWEVRFRFE